jgi:hypothetical protein
MDWMTSKHRKWFVDTGQRLKTADGVEVAVWEFNHQNDATILSAWAKHFRNHYCLDCDIDALRSRRSRKDYLNDIKFPSNTTNLGPGIRAGDFGEILLADYVEWVLGFMVPRVRWSSKVIRDESPKGSDVIGFRFHRADAVATPKDLLGIFESKTNFSGARTNRLQDAIVDSAKDHLRIDESLNYIKQRLLEKQQLDLAKKVERFQDPVGYPYVEIFGAAAIYSNAHYNVSDITSANGGNIRIDKTSKKPMPHPNRSNLVIIVIKGPDLMNLVHTLYQRAADEA